MSDAKMDQSGSDNESGQEENVKKERSRKHKKDKSGKKHKRDESEKGGKGKGGDDDNGEGSDSEKSRKHKRHKKDKKEKKKSKKDKKDKRSNKKDKKDKKDKKKREGKDEKEKEKMEKSDEKKEDIEMTNAETKEKAPDQQQQQQQQPVHATPQPTTKPIVETPPPSSSSSSPLPISAPITPLKFAPEVSQSLPISVPVTNITAQQPPPDIKNITPIAVTQGIAKSFVSASEAPFIKPAYNSREMTADPDIIAKINMAVRIFLGQQADKPEPLRFPMPESLSLPTLDDMKLQDWVAGFKFNGDRCYVLIINEGVFRIPRGYNIIEPQKPFGNGGIGTDRHTRGGGGGGGGGLIPPQMRMYRSALYESCTRRPETNIMLLDGDWREKETTADGVIHHEFCAHDMLVIKKTSIVNEPFHKRLEALNLFINMANEMSKDPLFSTHANMAESNGTKYCQTVTILAKKYVPMDKVSIIADRLVCSPDKGVIIKAIDLDKYCESKGMDPDIPVPWFYDDPDTRILVPCDGLIYQNIHAPWYKGKGSALPRITGPTGVLGDEIPHFTLKWKNYPTVELHVIARIKERGIIQLAWLKDKSLDRRSEVKHEALFDVQEKTIDPKVLEKILHAGIGRVAVETIYLPQSGRWHILDTRPDKQGEANYTTTVAYTLCRTADKARGNGIGACCPYHPCALLFSMFIINVLFCLGLTLSKLISIGNKGDNKSIAN